MNNAKATLIGLTLGITLWAVTAACTPDPTPIPAPTPTGGRVWVDPNPLYTPPTAGCTR